MTKNKFLIAEYIDSNRENIIEKYEQDMPINAIAELYGVSRSIIYLRLIKWGVTLRRYKGARRRKEERLVTQKHYKRQFSKAFLAQRAINTKKNNDKKKGIKYIKSEHSTADQKLVDNLLSRPIIG